jgi:pentatricopeptide repeat protein
LGRLIAEGVTPDSISFSTLINGFVREDHMDKAFLWMNKMEKEGLLLDIITYNVVMNGFCRQGRMQEAELVLRKMIKKGINPGRSAYTALKN